MAATGKTPILLYGSTTASNVPVAGNLTNSSDGCEIAINVADKNLFFKDSTNAVNTVPIRQSSASSNGWLSSTDWSTFNGKASTSSPTFSGNVTLSAGNLVIGTSGKGIDFSATAGTGTSELLADYEEGIWTPVVTSGSGSITTYTSSGSYTKAGNTLTVFGKINVTNVGTSSGNLNFSGLPFTSQNLGSYIISVISREDNVTGSNFSVIIRGNNTNGIILSPNWTNNVLYLFSATYLVS